jgi:hypothetical protein
MTDSRFAYIWEYRVKPSSEAAFLEFYGPGGAPPRCASQGRW